MGFATNALLLVQLMLLVSTTLTVFASPIPVDPPSHHPHPPTPAPVYPPTYHHGHPPSEAPAHPPTYHHGHPPSEAPAHHHHHHHHHGHPPSHSPVHPPAHHEPPHHAPPSHPPVLPPSHPPHYPPHHYPPHHPPRGTPVPRSFVAVQGVVYCKSCKYAGSDTLLGASPIDGAVVKFQCNNTKYPVIQTAKTDKNGYFFITAPKTITSFGAHKCKVFIVSSPLASCNKPTDLHYGLQGASLRPEKPYMADKLPFILYTVGPFAFDPKCPL
ncbi:non-classical arabinogalactan protein 31-like [Quercus lobata]|uniref:Uncharacterized protein n=1 Tax=Quercus lobata TaxID=97700 RepID=A0A7N2LNL7_QUELO|nr:non-classical arabinogalactan protein 31-like [Quercus lobata]